MLHASARSYARRSPANAARRTAYCLPSDDITARLRSIAERTGVDTISCAVLDCLGYVGAATSTQLVTRYWTNVGQGRTAAYRALHQLVAANLLIANPLHGTGAGRSADVMSLTRHGWRALGIEPPADWRGLPSERLDARLQLFETLMVRSAEDWRIAARGEAYEALCRAVLARRPKPFRGSVEDQLRESVFRTVHRGLMQEVHAPVLRNMVTGDTRILLAYRSQKALASELAELPSLVMFSPVAFEICCGNPNELERAQQAVSRFFGRRVQCAFTAVQSFRARRSTALTVPTTVRPCASPAGYLA